MVASSGAAGGCDPTREPVRPLEATAGDDAGAAGAGVSSAPSDWSRIAERGSALGIRMSLWWYRIFGRLLTVPVAYLVVTYFFLTDAPGRRASLAYLRRVYANPAGRASLGRAPGVLAGFRHYRTFALAIVDRFSVWCDGPERFEFDTRGGELIDRYVNQGRGVLILSAHLGNFDALRRLAERTGEVVNVLMYTDNAKRINDLFSEVSPEIRDRMIVVDPTSVHSVFAIRERLRAGEHVAILADRNELGDRARSVPVQLLGGEVRFPQAPVELAGLLGCPVVLLVALREGSGRYRVFIESLAERVKLPRRGREVVATELMAAFAKRLEYYCCQRPYQWFNFYDYWGDAERSDRAVT
jgi:predicted LPLAT superfamily acyltransferase